jgi:hypothetical protein
MPGGLRQRMLLAPEVGASQLSSHKLGVRQNVSFNVLAFSSGYWPTIEAPKKSSTSSMGLAIAMVELPAYSRPTA